jgi:hypothetical protein
MIALAKPEAEAVDHKYKNKYTRTIALTAAASAHHQAGERQAAEIGEQQQLRQQIATMRARRASLDELAAALEEQETAAHAQAGHETLADLRARHDELAAALAETQAALDAAQAALLAHRRTAAESLATWPDRLEEARGRGILATHETAFAAVVDAYRRNLQSLEQGQSALDRVPGRGNGRSTFRVDALEAMSLQAGDLRALLESAPHATRVLAYQRKQLEIMTGEREPEENVAWAQHYYPDGRPKSPEAKMGFRPFF